MKRAPYLLIPREVQCILSRVASLNHPSPVYLVGGAIRDIALKRKIGDIDLASADAKTLALRASRLFNGTLVTLDADNDVYRLIIPVSQSTDIQHIDFARILGQDIEEDLQRRDFTINAIAWKLKVPVLARIAHSGLIDPRKGLFDIGRKILRAEKDSLFVDDPLRLLRAFRIKAQLNFKIEPGTFKRITRHRRLITRPAGERIQSELMALLTVPGASKILKEMDDGRFLTTLFADLEPARRCAQSYYGTGGVLRHSLDVCSRVDFLFTHFKTIYPDLDAPFKKYLASRMSGGISPKAILLLAALLHDVAKPQTAKMISGRLRFYEHDTQGALRAEKILLAMRFSREHIHTITEVIRHHLRPGHLVASGLPLTDRAIYRFFRDLGELAPSLLTVCWGDHASYLSEKRLQQLLTAACGRKHSDPSKLKPEEARKTVLHLQLASLLLRRYFDSSRTPVPQRLLGGAEVMKALKIAPGPKVGEILEHLREAQAEGKVMDRASALEFISRLK